MGNLARQENVITQTKRGQPQFVTKRGQPQFKKWMAVFGKKKQQSGSDI